MVAALLVIAIKGRPQPKCGCWLHAHQLGADSLCEMVAARDSDQAELAALTIASLTADEFIALCEFAGRNASNSTSRALAEWHSIKRRGAVSGWSELKKPTEETKESKDANILSAAVVILLGSIMFAYFVAS